MNRFMHRLTSSTPASVDCKPIQVFFFFFFFAMTYFVALQSTDNHAIVIVQTELGLRFCIPKYKNSIFVCARVPCRYGDAVRELDYGVGVILSALKAAGVEKNTLVMFSSDNGGATYAKERGMLILLCNQGRLSLSSWHM